MNLFRGLRPLQRAGALRDVLAGVVLAAMDIPQVLGCSRIAGMPVMTGLYSLLLPLLAFAAFGSSRYLVVAADSATAAIFTSGMSGLATPAGDAVCGSGGSRGAADGWDSAAGAAASTGVHRGFSLADSAGGFSNRRGVSGGDLGADRDVGSAGGFAPPGGAALGGASRSAPSPSADSAIGGFGVGVCGEESFILVGVYVVGVDFSATNRDMLRSHPVNRVPPG